LKASSPVTGGWCKTSGAALICTTAAGSVIVIPKPGWKAKLGEFTANQIAADGRLKKSRS
jgi:hypothetical protein